MRNASRQSRLVPAKGGLCRDAARCVCYTITNELAVPIHNAAKSGGQAVNGLGLW